MKKTILYITIIMLLTIIVAGSTYAFFYFTINIEENKVTTSAEDFEIIYTGGSKISGELEMVNTKEEGKKSTVHIRKTEDSIAGTANLYIKIEQMTSNLATEALRWEVYKTYNNVETWVASGDFTYCKSNNALKKCSSGDKLYLINNYQLSTMDTAFTVYIWLDGNKATSDVVDGYLKGHIGAETETITGNLG